MSVAQPLIGLVDGNNFYCSVERIFDPKLRGVPVVVMSNNDGCAIARSNEAKALGIGMGQPIHQIPSHIRKQLHVRSANFALYGDISARIATILRDLFPDVEVYSIDESFVSFDGIRAQDRRKIAMEARARILKWVGVPCCVGIGPTKTLAKMGNKIAKGTEQGVWNVRRPDLGNFPIGDVWGVGRKFAARLMAEGITTAAHLVSADPRGIQDRYGVVLVRTQTELNGVRCAELQEEEPERQQIMVSRSFGSEIHTHDDLAQAVATFAQRAAEKLRARHLTAHGVWVFFHTNPFGNSPQYHPSRTVRLVAPTADTRTILEAAQTATAAMYRPHVGWKKAGVGLVDLSAEQIQQTDLFAPVRNPKSEALMKALDAANHKFGRGSVSFASSSAGPGGAPKWAMRQEHLSRSFTTRWNEILTAR
ncbi:Y-family DNA polymerase [Stenotrophomonas maltophilia]|uniref:Y-family DNA polymerase n=1 Tax=Stenotrophomonas maltophilia TaxID=40324 RepID=UPI0013121EF5|nr:Y-family DNA polymerase [Stenotrophomonas maltophilia]